MKVASNAKRASRSGAWRIEVASACGDPARDVPGSGDAGLQGFATDISVNRGSTVQFKIDAITTAYPPSRPEATLSDLRGTE
jgi:hypothetical protein